MIVCVWARTLKNKKQNITILEGAKHASSTNSDEIDSLQVVEAFFNKRNINTVVDIFID